MSRACAGGRTAAHPELGEGVGVVGESEGVECLTGVERVQTLTGRAAVHTVSLDQTHQQHLCVRQMISEQDVLCDTLTAGLLALRLLAQEIAQVLSLNQKQDQTRVC